MGWVTLDDGQRVFIGPGGRVLATRSQISSASGGKERGKTLAGSSKAAIGRGFMKGRKAKTTRESGLVPRSEQATKEERLAAIVQRSRAREGVWKSNTPFLGHKLLPSKEEVKAEVTRQNREAGAEKSKTTRAKALAEKHAAEASARLKDAAAQTRAIKGTTAQRAEQLGQRAAARANRLMVNRESESQIVGARAEKLFGRAKSESPATTRAVEHARAAAVAKPSLREQAEKARAAKGQVSTSRAEYLAKIGKPEKDAGVDNRASKLDLRKIADEARAAKGQVSTSKAEYLAKIKARKEATAKPAKRYR